MVRFLDLILSGSAILAMFPLFLPVILILRFTGEKEIFFSQKRVGLGGSYFNLLKFATMLKDSPKIGTGTVTLKNDPRVLPFGKLLRKTKINELPQLMNVLIGDMSLIGPRPQDERCFCAFPPSSQNEIKKVQPGLSGIGSIIFRSEDELVNLSKDAEEFYDNVIMPYKGELEEWFVHNNTLKNYLLLIFTTLWVVVFPNSKIVWRLFPKLPPPPKPLVSSLNYR
jgi:lipopolysaccharide/colanic/teichoic acid biosynthesis glycosyltransferase